MLNAIKIFLLSFGFNLKDSETELLLCYMDFFFSNYPNVIYFSQTGTEIRSINKSQNLQTTVMPTFSCFSNALYFTVCQSRIDSFFLQFKEDANTLDAKSKGMLKYQEKVFKEKVFELG